MLIPPSRVSVTPPWVTMRHAAKHSSEFRFNVALMFKRVHEGPFTFVDLATASNMAESTVAEYVTAMWREWVVYVHAWERHPLGVPKPVFNLGAQKDLPRPKPQSQSVIKKRYRAKKRELALQATFRPLESNDGCESVLPSA